MGIRTGAYMTRDEESGYDDRVLDGINADGTTCCNAMP